MNHCLSSFEKIKRNPLFRKRSNKMQFWTYCYLHHCNRRTLPAKSKLGVLSHQQLPPPYFLRDRSNTLSFDFSTSESNQRSILHRPFIAHSISQVNNPFSVSLSYPKISFFLWFWFESLKSFLDVLIDCFYNFFTYW
jgi:hypothetical protein